MLAILRLDVPDHNGRTLPLPEISITVGQKPMSVAINYEGRFGNHIFQYACARLFAQDQGLRLVTELSAQDQDILPASASGDGATYTTPAFELRDGDEVFGKPFPPGRYVFNGYFQKAAWYHGRRTDVERMFRPTPVLNKNTRDIVANIRLGDYRSCKVVIHPDWYLDVLAKETFGRLYIVSDERDEGYLANFRKYDPIFVPGTPAHQWNFLRSFDRIIASNSTFCWWACFFSEATRVYTFKR